MITKTAIALAGVLTAAPVLVPSTASAQVQVQTSCQWAQLEDGAWVCVPNNPQIYTYDDTPYAYYYAPNIGWGWHVSPWGYGHPWRGRWNAGYGHYAPHYQGHYAPQYHGYYGGARVAPHYYGGQHYVGHYGGGAHYYGGGHYAGHGGGHR